MDCNCWYLVSDKQIYLTNKAFTICLGTVGSSLRRPQPTSLTSLLAAAL